MSRYRQSFSEALEEVYLEKIQPFMISYSDRYGKHAGFEGGDSLQDIQNKAANLRKRGFKIDKMGRYNPPVGRKEDAFDVKTEACWTGYKQVGMKNKGGKQVPNCVPEDFKVEDFILNELEESMQDYLKSKLDAKQLQNLKGVWAKKNASDVTPSIKAMIKKMDIPTQLAIKQADIPHISKLVEEVEELEEFNMAQLDRLAKEYEPMRNKTISIDNANKLRKIFDRIPDSMLPAIRKKKIPFLSALALSRMVQKGIPVREWMEDYDDVLNEGTGTITNFRNDREVTNMMSLAKQHGVQATLVGSGTGAKVMLKGNMRKILDMQLAAQRSGLKAEEILFVEVKEEEELPKKVAKKNEPDQMADTEVKKEGDDTEKLKKELEKKDDEIAMLKTKQETEKAKVAKKETEKLVNPETGEPLLQVGIAYKHLKDKMMKKKEEVKEDLDSKDKPLVKKIITKLKGASQAHAGQAKDLEKAMKTEMKKDDAYAIGMAQAKKVMNDEPPLDKKTIKKGHEIADKILKKEDMDAQPQDKDVKSKDGTQPKKYYKNLSKKTKDDRADHFAKRDTTKNDNSPAPGDKGAKTKPSIHTNKYKKMYGEGKMSQISAMQDQGKSAAEIAKALKLPLRAVKTILGEKTEHSAKEMYEQIAGLKKKSEKSGMPYGILKKVYDRGMAAWRGGHRPGTTQQQWAFARVNSFITKSSGTWGGADKDLAKQVRGK